MTVNTHYRYVAFFDVLGMKRAIQRNLDEAWGALCDLGEAYRRILSLEIRIPSADMIIRDRIRKCILSDSIILYTLSDEVEDLFSIIMLSAELFKNGLNLCVPLRGAIAYGRFYFNEEEKLYLGQAQVQAYELSESSDWLGIVVDEEVRKRSQPLCLNSRGRDVLVCWDVPRKHDASITRTALNWPVVFQDNFCEEGFDAAQFYSATFERMLGPYNDLSEDVKAKYENTVSFIRAQI